MRPDRRVDSQITVSYCQTGNRAWPRGHACTHKKDHMSNTKETPTTNASEELAKRGALPRFAKETALLILLASKAGLEDVVTLKKVDALRGQLAVNARLAAENAQMGVGKGRNKDNQRKVTLTKAFTFVDGEQISLTVTDIVTACRKASEALGITNADIMLALAVREGTACEPVIRWLKGE